MTPVFKITAIREGGVFGDTVIFKAISPFLPRIGEEIDREKTYKVKRIIYDFSDFNKECNTVNLILE